MAFGPLDTNRIMVNKHWQPLVRRGGDGVWGGGTGPYTNISYISPCQPSSSMQWRAALR